MWRILDQRSYFFFYREKLVPYWLTRFWKIFFFRVPKSVRNKKSGCFFFFMEKLPPDLLTHLKGYFFFPGAGEKNSIFTYSMNFDFTPCTWVVKYLFQTCLFFLFDFQAKNVFLILNWKTMFQNFTLCTWVFKYLLLFVEWNVEYAPIMSLSCPVPVRGPNLNIEARFRPILS